MGIEDFITYRCVMESIWEDICLMKFSLHQSNKEILNTYCSSRAVQIHRKLLELIINDSKDTPHWKHGIQDETQCSGVYLTY